MLYNFTRFSQQSKEQQQQQKPTPSILSCNKPLSPLDIPELLQLIFSFIDRYTLAVTVIRVCRQWFYLNLHRLRRDLVWDIQWQPMEPKQALACLHGADRLVLGCSEGGFSWNGPDIKQALSSLQQQSPGFLQSTLVAPFSWYRNDKQAAHIVQLLDRTLREMVFTSSHNFWSGRLNLLPFPPSLRSLTIEKDDWFSWDVARILAMCPLLESFHLSSSREVYFHGPFMDQGRLALPSRLALRSLVLRKPLVTQAWMEDLLTITPNLEELQLIAISRSNNWQWSWPRFRDHLRTLSLSLKQFHFSQYLHSTVNEEQEQEILAICPTAQERTIMPYYLSPPMAKYLTEQPVALTTLNIIQVYHNLHCIHYGWLANYLDRGSGYVPITWHRLLCESSNLRHLKTLKMPYMTDYMDLHRRSVIYSKAVPSVIVPGVWICRGLERLHLDLHTHEHATARGSHQTRIAYGYIARVCPHLQDLRIRFPGNCEFFEGYAQWKHHPFVLEGGLCLLSGLKCLERLRLEYRTVECEIAELNWLCQSGRNEEHRVRRRQLVEGWLWRLEHEAKLEADRLQSTAGAAIGLLGPGADDEKLMASLASLGLLQDVKDVMVTMDKYGFVCLPSLQLLACGDHLPQRPEKEMRSLFYVEPLGLIERLSNYSPF